MVEKAIRVFKWAHLFLRLVLAAIVVRFALELVSIHSPFGRTTLWQFDISDLILPLYVGLEFWFMRKERGEAKALLIDVTLLITWFLIRALFAIIFFTSYVA